MSNTQGPAPNGSVRKVAVARKRAGNMGKALVSSAHLIVCKPDTACLMASCHGLERSTESLSIVFSKIVAIFMSKVFVAIIVASS
jgi:hypothetical protein